MSQPLTKIQPAPVVDFDPDAFDASVVLNGRKVPIDLVELRDYMEKMVRDINRSSGQHAEKLRRIDRFQVRDRLDALPLPTPTFGDVGLATHLTTRLGTAILPGGTYRSDDKIAVAMRPGLTPGNQEVWRTLVTSRIPAEVVADGITDDSAALQAAIDEIATLPFGGCLLLEDKSYFLGTTPLSLTDHQVGIVGCGTSTKLITNGDTAITVGDGVTRYFGNYLRDLNIATGVFSSDRTAGQAISADTLEGFEADGITFGDQVEPVPGGSNNRFFRHFLLDDVWDARITNCYHKQTHPLAGSTFYRLVDCLRVVISNNRNQWRSRSSDDMRNRIAEIQDCEDVIIDGNIFRGLGALQASSNIELIHILDSLNILITSNILNAGNSGGAPGLRAAYIVSLNGTNGAIYLGHNDMRGASLSAMVLQGGATANPVLRWQNAGDDFWESGTFLANTVLPGSRPGVRLQGAAAVIVCTTLASTFGQDLVSIQFEPAVGSTWSLAHLGAGAGLPMALAGAVPLPLPANQRHIVTFLCDVAAGQWREISRSINL